MSRRARQRKAYRPKLVALNAIQRAIEGAALLPREQVAGIKAILANALVAFGRGEQCAGHWRSMADALNVAEGLAAIGICSDDDSTDRISAGQQALANVQQRHTARGSWTLYPAERQALDDALWLHGIQLEHTSFSEYERAVDNTRERIRQAIAGNAPRGAVVLQGAIA
jgi:hypothetical protein